MSPAPRGGPLAQQRQRARERSAASSVPGTRERAAFDQRGRALLKTLVGGAVAVVAALYWLTRELGLDSAELIDFAITSLGFIALFAVPGIVVGAVLGALRRRR